MRNNIQSEQYVPFSSCLLKWYQIKKIKPKRNIKKKKEKESSVVVCEPLKFRLIHSKHTSSQTNHFQKVET